MRRQPCAQCPFTRRIAPGYLGGSPVETFIGQIVGPFWIPCHCSHDYEGKESDAKKVDQCAGAAILRANIGVDDKMPAPCLRLPPNHRAVFTSLAEFYAHHERVTVAEANGVLTHHAVQGMLRQELADVRLRQIDDVKEQMERLISDVKDDQAHR